jgi:hypothetical protein
VECWNIGYEKRKAPFYLNNVEATSFKDVRQTSISCFHLEKNPLLREYQRIFVCFDFFALSPSFHYSIIPIEAKPLLYVCHMGRDSGYFFVTYTNDDRVFGHQQGEFVGSLFCNDVLHLIDQVPFVLSGQIGVIGSNRYPLLPVAGCTKFIDIKSFTILGRGWQAGHQKSQQR